MDNDDPPIAPTMRPKPARCALSARSSAAVRPPAFSSLMLMTSNRFFAFSRSYSPLISSSAHKRIGQSVYVRMS